MIRLLLTLLLTALPAFASDSSSDAQAGCCCVGVVIAILVGIGISQKRKQEESPVSGQVSPPSSSSPPGSFQLRAVSSVQDLGAGNMECISIKIRGPVNMHPSQLTGLMQLSLWDVTAGSSSEQRKPVLCSVPDLQLKDTQVFHWLHIHQMPYVQSMMADWTDIISVPVQSLTFPAKGRRKLEFEFRITSIGVENGPVNVARCTFYQESRSFGYVDGIRQRIKTEELGMKLAAAVSAVDGSLDDVEKKVIRDWMDSKIEILPEDMRPDVTRQLSRALMLAEKLGARISPAEVGNLVTDTLKDYPVDTLPAGDRYDVVKLCLKVAAADGTAGPEEMKLVDEISDLLKVDKDAFEKDRDKFLPASMQSGQDTESMLGLNPEWTRKEKKKHLRGLYREWHARVTHSDPVMKEQAEAMLKLIAESRAKLDAEG